MSTGAPHRRALRITFASDYDGDLNMIAEPTERDAAEWRVVVALADGERVELQPGGSIRWLFPYEPPEGATLWWVDHSNGAWIEVTTPDDRQPRYYKTRERGLPGRTYPEPPGPWEPIQR